MSMYIERWLNQYRTTTRSPLKIPWECQWNQVGSPRHPLVTWERPWDARGIPGQSFIQRPRRGVENSSESGENYGIGVWRIPREVGRIIQRGPLTKHMLQNVFWLKLSSHFGSSKTPTRKKTKTLSLFFRGGSIYHPEKKNKSLSLFLVKLSSHFGSTPTRKKESRFCLFDFLIQKYVFY